MVLCSLFISLLAFSARADEAQDITALKPVSRHHEPNAPSHHGLLRKEDLNGSSQSTQAFVDQSHTRRKNSSNTHAKPVVIADSPTRRHSATATSTDAKVNSSKLHISQPAALLEGAEAKQQDKKRQGSAVSAKKRQWQLAIPDDALPADGAEAEQQCKAVDVNYPKPIAAIFSVDHSGSVGAPGWDVFSSFTDILGSIILGNSVNEDLLNGVIWGQWGHPKKVDVCPGKDMTEFEFSNVSFQDCIGKTGYASNPNGITDHTKIMNPGQTKSVSNMDQGTIETIKAMKALNPNGENYTCWLILASDCNQWSGTECAPSKPLVAAMMEPPYNCTVFGVQFGRKGTNDAAWKAMQDMVSPDGEGGKLAWHYDNFAQMAQSVGSKSAPKGLAADVGVCAAEMKAVILKKLEAQSAIPDSLACRRRGAPWLIALLAGLALMS